jgi:hypothetical protein
MIDRREVADDRPTTSFSVSVIASAIAKIVFAAKSKVSLTWLGASGCFKASLIA